MVNPYGSTNSVVVPIVVYSSPIITGSLPVTYSNLLNVNFMTLYAGAIRASRYPPSALGRFLINGSPTACRWRGDWNKRNIVCVASGYFDECLRGQQFAGRGD